MKSLDQPTNGNRHVRDAIVMSGWGWEMSGLVERLALAISILGGKVLYCENPVSRFRGRGRTLEKVTNGVFRFGPEFLGHRLNRLPLGFSQFQARMVTSQVLETASRLSLRDPLFIYAWGDFMVSVCREFRRKGFPAVHCCFDYPEPGQDKHVELSGLTLTISKTVFHQLKAKYGEKIALIPEVRWASDPCREAVAPTSAGAEFAAIPRPRLGYIGQVSDRLNLRVLEKVLLAHPDWQFLHFDPAKCLPLPNVHAISWREPEKLKDVVANLDVGFMPYDCYSNKNFHCLPIKLFDYFCAGLPVVSTPIVNLWEFSDTIYFGDDADQLGRAIQLALDEPPDSPLKLKRMAIARTNSIETLANVLADVLPSCEKTSNVAAV
ncbi:MAG: hypothetical protein WAM59_05085 [Candidatus Acidiferrales bacterium]